MAKIKITNTLRYSPESLPVSPLNQVGNVVDSNGLSAIAQVGTEMLYQRKVAIDADYTSDASVKAQRNILAIQQQKKEQMESPAGFADEVDKESQSVYQDYLNNAPSAAAKDTLQTYFSRQRANNYTRNFEIEGELIAENALSNATDNINIITNHIQDNPESLAASIEYLTPVFERVILLVLIMRLIVQRAKESFPLMKETTMTLLSRHKLF